MLLFLVEKNEAALYNRRGEITGEEHYEIHDNG